ncbi:putative nitrogen fixation protein NifT [Skermanella sp. TT6]|uniref:Nitrogen fixation protein NifT n=1 Tax=Skermanella cutis TaxID=2775420 RepID=A0ABX7BAD8_9PROT|nr:putative nitrogen fixation protein NifT [Skermanella sp. TT6]QQP91360.1 putative nitrogen fixation protein NifT [Skermanella sp. TT6]
MKVMLRKSGGQFMIYVAKKDLETNVVSSEKPAIWGGKVTLENGWVLEMPDLPEDTRLPLTVEARKIEG